MTIQCFTSINLNYLARARVLAWTLRRQHPDWRLSVCVVDRPPRDFRADSLFDSFDDVIWAEDMDIENLPAWLFKRDVVEACTAVKGPILNELINSGVDKVFYLDPDIAVLGSLSPLVELLDTNSILLTPHQLSPDDEIQAIIDNEICSLVHGVYNLGFLAVKNDRSGREFTGWWRNRLMEFCYNEKERGIFVDQKWCDHAPSMFDEVKILRDPGYNVASWNLSRRKISINDKGEILVNGVPLRFFHFTKLGPIGDTMTARYARENTEVYEIWSWYRRKVMEFSDSAIPAGYWYYGEFDNGLAIPKSVRELYRGRRDLQEAFPNPFQTGENGFYAWLQSEEPDLLRPS
ncbi:MAG: hypothetical protein J2P31_06495 [Blastocatellia bacterium]|nr:hypothetical protein [Blastocatellia bacterium]